MTEMGDSSSFTNDDTPSVMRCTDEQRDSWQVDPENVWTDTLMEQVILH